MSKQFTFGGIFCSLVLATVFVGCSGEVADIVDNNEDLTAAEKEQALSLDIDFDSFRIIVEDEFVGANDDVVRYKRYEHIGFDEAYVIFLNGRTEFIEKYDPLFTANYEMDWATSAEQTLSDLPVTFFAIDHAGQGKSGGMRSHIDDYDTYTANVLGLINHVQKLNCHHKPIYIMARSMGGLIAARFAQQHPEYVDGLIFASPMFGIQPPPGVELAQLEQLAGAYVNGFGMAERCARAVDPMILGAIAQCLGDPTGACQPCFMGDPAAENCDMMGLPWDAMRAGYALLNDDSTISCEQITVRNPEYSCTFPGDGFNGTSSDYDYCYWMESNPIAGPDMTFGWLYESFEAIGEMNEVANMDAIRHIPTLVLSSPIDPIVNPLSHGAFCSEMNDCQLVEFETNWATGPFYFHELLAETDRASVVAEIRTFLEARI